MSSPAPEPPPAIAPETVTSSEIITSVYASLLGGLIFYATWVLVRGPLRHIYQKRTQLPDLRCRPPPLRLAGLLHRCAGFFAPVFLLSDGELVQTAGLDALILCRFLVLGMHVFVPVSALCCAVLIPLCRTGTAVETAQYAGTASIMRYTLSNVEQGSIKLWASFALSYAVLAWVGYCLYQHYKSFALYRLLHLRTTAPAGIAPRMDIVGMQQRGWPAVRVTLLKLLSPYYMLRSDTAYARRMLEELNAAEVAGAADASSGKEQQEALGDAGSSAKEQADASGTAADADAAAPLLPKAGDQPAKGVAEPAEEDWSSSAVLPWWLPPERVPPEYSAAWGTNGVIAGKTCPTLRKRVLAENAAGRPMWVSLESYAVLLTTAGPPPSKELWSLLRPAPDPPHAVLVDSPKDTGQPGQLVGQEQGEGERARGDDELKRSSSESTAAAAAADNQHAGRGAELVASQLTRALQDLFPGSFTQLVRVFNHHDVDCLLSKHEGAATQRDRCATAVAAQRQRLQQQQQQQQQLPAAAAEGDAAEGEGGGLPAAADVAAALKVEDATAGSCSAAGKAAARLARAEAELAKWQGRVEALEAKIEEARREALQRPLGTAFIALFSDQTAAATAACVHGSLVATVNFQVRPCPGPDDLNWPALWASWMQRTVRAVAVVPVLTAIMIFPIGVLTGALSNLTTAVCGGTEETNSLYWPWYCEQDSFAAKLLKGLLQGVIPSLISMTWDTYVLPMVFYFTCQSELRHLALSDLDRRITTLFFCFDIFNSFLGAVLGGAIFQQIGSLVSEPGYWLQTMGTSLPTASTYFLNYIIIHALCTNWFRFVWPHEGTVLFVIFRALGLFRPKCERDHTMIRTPPSYRGGRHYGSFLLIFVMALPYAVVAPLVLPAAAGFFFTAWMAWRYCAIYFYERSYESGGRMFEVLFSLMVWAMSLFSMFTSLVLAAKEMWTAALVALVTQQIALLLYHKKVVLSVGHYAHSLPLHATLSAPRVRPDPASYLPPPLRKQAVGWYPEWGKVWEKYGISRHSL